MNHKKTKIGIAGALVALALLFIGLGLLVRANGNGAVGSRQSAAGPTIAAPEQTVQTSASVATQEPTTVVMVPTVVPPKLEPTKQPTLTPEPTTAVPTAQPTNEPTKVPTETKAPTPEPTVAPPTETPDVEATQTAVFQEGIDATATAHAGCCTITIVFTLPPGQSLTGSWQRYDFVNGRFNPVGSKEVLSPQDTTLPVTVSSGWSGYYEFQTGCCGTVTAPPTGYLAEGTTPIATEDQRAYFNNVTQDLMVNLALQVLVQPTAVVPTLVPTVVPTQKPTTASVGWTVIDGKSEDPLNGASVIISLDGGAAAFSQTSDSNGKVSFTGLPLEGQGTVYLSHQDYASSRRYQLSINDGVVILTNSRGQKVHDGGKIRLFKDAPSIPSGKDSYVKESGCEAGDIDCHRSAAMAYPGAVSVIDCQEVDLVVTEGMPQMYANQDDLAFAPNAYDQLLHGVMCTAVTGSGEHVKLFIADRCANPFIVEKPAPIPVNPAPLPPPGCDNRCNQSPPPVTVPPCTGNGCNPPPVTNPTCEQMQSCACEQDANYCAPPPINPCENNGCDYGGGACPNEGCPGTGGGTTMCGGPCNDPVITVPETPISENPVQGSTEIEPQAPPPTAPSEIPTPEGGADQFN